MIARKNTNLSHPKQTSLKLKIVPFQVDNYFTTSIPARDKDTDEVPLDDETLRQRLAEREDIRQRLLEAGLLVTDIDIADFAEDWDEEEFADLELPIQLPPNSKTIAEWLEEERGEY